MPNQGVVVVRTLSMPKATSYKLAGPVFTLMDENTYQLSLDEDIQQMHLGRLFPTVTYAAGVSVKLGKVSVIDIRYADQFRGSWAAVCI